MKSSEFVTWNSWGWNDIFFFFFGCGGVMLCFGRQMSYMREWGLTNPISPQVLILPYLFVVF